MTHVGCWENTRMLFIFSGQNTQLIPTTTGTLKITSEFLTTETNDQKRMNLLHQLLQVLWHKRCFWDIQLITSMNQHPQKKNLKSFHSWTTFHLTFMISCVPQECWNILTIFFISAIIFIWSWGWLKMQSLWYHLILPGCKSSKSFNNLNAVHGFTLTVAAASTGSPFGIFKTWSSDTTKCLHQEPFFSEKKTCVNILSCRHFNALESDKEK